jgi:hypothetical protein
MIAKTMTFYVIGEESAYGLTCLNSSGASLNFSSAAGFGSVNEAVAVDFGRWERVS